jgi:hypothetical protein
MQNKVVQSYFTVISYYLTKRNENKHMHTSIVKFIAVIVIFASGAFAHSFYFKSPRDMVQLQRTDSGLFVLSEGHIYNVEKLEMTPSYIDGASQSYRLPTGRK